MPYVFIFFNIKLEAHYNVFLILTKQLQSFGIMQSRVNIKVQTKSKLYTKPLPVVKRNYTRTQMHKQP